MIEQFERFWAGTEESFQHYLLSLHMAVKQGYYERPRQAEERPRSSRLLTVQGSVGLIQTTGSLVNAGDSYVNAYMGRTGYAEIREAFALAAQDPNVKVILHNIGSGGGHAAGVDDVSEMIARVDRTIKPVVTFTDSTMASAAYWLGSASRRVYASPTADVGSIGVLAVHMEQSKLLEEIGIKATVFRSGPFKALGHGAEPLSDLGRETIQAEVDKLATLFTNKMAERRGQPAEVFNKRAGQGRMFIGADALAAGLVDGITSFDELFSSLDSAAREVR